MDKDKEIKTFLTQEMEIDSIFKEILMTENDFTKRSSHLLKNRYEKEKENWERIIAEKDLEIKKYTENLKEMEKKINQLNEQIYQERINYLESSKIYITQLQESQNRENEKWKLIEEEISKYRNILLENENKLIQEQNRLNFIKESFKEKENTFKDRINELEMQNYILKQQISFKEQDSIREKSIYEGKIQSLIEELEDIKTKYKQEKEYYEEIVADRNEEIKKYRQLIEELTSQHNKLKLENDDLKNRIEKYKTEILRVEEEKLELNKKIDIQKKEFTEQYENQKKRFEMELGDYISKENVLKEKLQEQIDRMSALISTLEEKLKDESRIREKLEKEFTALKAEASENKILLEIEKKKNNELTNAINRNLEDYRRRIVDEQIKYKMRVDELNKIEIENLKKQLEIENSKRNELISLNQVLKVENEDMKSKILILESEKQEWGKLLEKEHEEIEKIKNENKMLNLKIKEFEEENKNLKAQIEFLEKTNENILKDTNDKILKLQEKYNSMMAQYRYEKEELQREIEHQAGTKQQHKLIIDDLNNRLNIYEQEKKLIIEKNQRELKMKESEINMLYKKIEELEEKIKEMTAKRIKEYDSNS